MVNHLYLPRDPIQTFLNAYTLCEAHRSRIHNLLQGDNEQDDYGRRANELRTMLASGATPARLRRKLVRTTDNEILLSALALLTALARHIAQRHAAELSRYSQPYRSSAAFGDVPYWLALDRPCLLAKSIAKRPRKLDELHDRIGRYHEPLVVTAGQHQEWRLTRISVDRSLENQFASRIDSGKFFVTVSPLSYEGVIRGESHRRHPPQPPDAFHLTAIEPLDGQASALRKVLERAYAERAAILVLPELRMPPPLLDVAREFLRRQTLTGERGLLMVAAGSWHVEVDGRFYNRCVVLSHFGEELWWHDKLREFVVTEAKVAAAPDLFGRIGIGSGGGSEAIQRGLAIEFYDSVIGRVAAAICIGFFSPEVEPLLQASGANVFLVPKMTPSMGDIEDRSKALVRTQHAFTFAANCGCVGARAPSFCRWPEAGEWNIGRLDDGKLALLLDLNNLSVSIVD